MRSLIGLLSILAIAQVSAMQIDPNIPLQVNPGINLPELYRAAEGIKAQRALAELRKAQAAAQNQAGGQNAEIARLQRELLELQIQQERLKLEQMQNKAGRPTYRLSTDRYVGLSDERITRTAKTCYYSFDSIEYDLSVPASDTCPQSIQVRENP